MSNQNDFFDKFKSDISNLDPVVWCEKYLTLDGKPFRVNGNGYKPFSDIYRYIGIKSLEKSSKPVIIVAGRQVGKTTLISAISAYFTCSGIAGNNGRQPMSLIHFFPTLIHAFAYAKGKLNPLISNSVQVEVGKKKMSYIESRLDKSFPTNDSLQFKQFIGSNVLRIESTGLDAARIRGITATLCAFDECQMISAQAISNANKVLTTSTYGPRGIEIYLGTPLQKGSNYWKMWNASSQQYYHLGCEQCKEYFPLYTPDDPDGWEKVWLYGYVVKCTKCGCEQNKLEAQERGKWIALNKDENCYYTGYHISQLYMPFFTKEDIIKEKPENHPVNTERAYMNEVLGQFYSGDSGIITPEEIQEKCGDMDRRMRANITSSDNLKVYAGYDWGKKQADSENSQGQSYSCAVILSADNSGLLSVDFCTMLKRNDFEEKKSIVDQMFRQYNVKLAVGDVGYANDLTEVLQHTHGDKFLGSEATAHINGHQKYVDDYFPKKIVFEKNYYIEEVYGLLKKGMIRFPYKDYERIVPLITHICSMEIKTTMNRIGEPQQTYVKNGVNDLFMAMINAYIAYKFDITKGFKNNPNSPNSLGGSGKIPAILAYSPRMR